MRIWMQRNKWLSLAVALLALLTLGLLLVVEQSTVTGWGFRWNLDVSGRSRALTATPSVTATCVPTAASTSLLVPSAIPTSTTTATPTATRLTSRVLSVPVILQELPLSCEFAGMRMLLSAILDNVPSEKELIACMPRDDNPNLGFRGDPAGYNRFSDGSINWSNYGVYAPAVAVAMNRCVLVPVSSKFMAVAENSTSYQAVASAVLDGTPVMVWVTKRQQVETMRVDTPQGSVQLAMGEHVWVVVGYHADGTFDVLDPYPQKDSVQTFHVHTFPNWELFDHMAVFVVPRATR